MLQQTDQFLLPWFISNLCSLLVVYVCYRWKNAGRLIFGLIFLLAACINAWMAIYQPSAYLEYGKLAFLDFYKEFIYGFFARNTGMFVMLIALGQLAISIGFFMNGKLFRPAILGAGVFLLAIVPLGVGSAFPATLFLLVALYFIVVKS